jgi:hypothetical protein
MGGSFSIRSIRDVQLRLVETMRHDMQRSELMSSGTSTGSAFGQGSIHTLAIEPVSGVHVLDYAPGNSPNTGPQCVEAMSSPELTLQGVDCAMGIVDWETGVGAVFTPRPARLGTTNTNTRSRLATPRTRRAATAVGSAPSSNPPRTAKTIRRARTPRTIRRLRTPRTPKTPSANTTGPAPAARRSWAGCTIGCRTD